MSDFKIPQDKLNELLAICEGHGNQPGELINILHKAQHLFGYLPAEVQKVVAHQLQIPVSKVYGVVTFYSFFSLQPKGKYVIGCCLGTACYVKGAQQVIDKFSEIIGIKPGETSADGLFTLDALRCIGACGIAPAVQINGKVYPKLEVSAIPAIVEEYRKEANN